MFAPFLDFGITDVIDIFFVAVLLYAAIVWAQSTRASFVVRGMFILGAVYILARQLDLQLTAWIFQGFFAILLIIIVVIFQEELRQMFERVAVWSLRTKPVPALRSETVDVLVRTLADLAKDRIGALVVVRGNDPLDRHVTGGIVLGGRLSAPLLKSIFDPHSPGHDGAVIIERGVITRFAAHLPLSEDYQQLASVGTRHAGALGLAELSDALCLVVSEERGEISYACDGQLAKAESLQEINAKLQEFLREKYPSGEARSLSIQLLRKNWVAKAVALSLASLLWYVFVPGSQIVEIGYTVPVKLENLPPDLELEEVQPPQVRAVLSGPRRAFYIFDPDRLAVVVDVSLAELGRKTFQITEQNLRYPKEMTLRELNPSTLRISVRKVSRREEPSQG
jgi:uncharacterized protein (TIGR00159 family)